MPSMTDLMNANRGTCRSCGAPIVWAITKTGRKNPVVKAPDDMKGNIQLKDDGNGELRALSVKPGEGPYISHFANCPNGPSHRKAKR